MAPTASDPLLQLEQLTQGQADLSRALDRALDALQNKTGFSARHLIDVCTVLRKHKVQVTQAVGMAAQDNQAREYLARLHQLRRDVNTRMSLLSTQPDIALGNEFETLCWETLAYGVTWLDNVTQKVQNSHQVASSAGEKRARIGKELSTSSLPNAITAQERDVQDAQDFDIDQILYCSLTNAPTNEAALEALTQNAAHMNRMDHITGMLMYADGVFVQLIEGPREALNALWARLLKDKRHKAVVQLYHRREVESRACEGWGMQLVERDMLHAIIHEAKMEVMAGRKTSWAPAIERMDFLLSNSAWGSFVQNMHDLPAATTD